MYRVYAKLLMQFSWGTWTANFILPRCIKICKILSHLVNPVWTSHLSEFPISDSLLFSLLYKAFLSELHFSMWFSHKGFFFFPLNNVKVCQRFKNIYGTSLTSKGHGIVFFLKICMLEKKFYISEIKENWKYKFFGYFFFNWDSYKFFFIVWYKFYFFIYFYKLYFTSVSL